MRERVRVMKGKNSKGEKRRYFIQDWREREKRDSTYLYKDTSNSKQKHDKNR